ncbi:hypothetical protein ACXYMO_09280 [Arenibacterium sp. CAU 1754]
MPYNFKIFDDLDVIRIVFHGAIVPQDILGLLDQLDENPLYHPKMDEIVFFKNLKYSGFNPETLENINEMARGIFLRGGHTKKIAIVAPDDPGRKVATAFCKKMSTYNSVQAQRFDTGQDALEFLGRSDRRLWTDIISVEKV